MRTPMTRSRISRKELDWCICPASPAPHGVGLILTALPGLAYLPVPMFCTLYAHARTEERERQAAME